MISSNENNDKTLFDFEMLIILRIGKYFFVMSFIPLLNEFLQEPDRTQDNSKKFPFSDKLI